MEQDKKREKSGASLNRGAGAWLIDNIIVIFLIVLFLSCALASENFLTLFNLNNLLRQYAAPTLIALGMLIVILTGGIDLSVGSVVALTNVVCATLIVEQEWHPLTAVLLSLTIGLLCGTVSGFLIAYKRIAPFIVTLAMMSITSSLSFILSNGTNIAIRREDFVHFGKLYLFRFGDNPMIPVQALIMILVTALVVVVLKYSSYGRIVTAIGSNEEAVRLSGIRVKITKLSVYALSGFFSSLGSILILTRSCVGTGRIGAGYELDAIAACVIGGASMAGGKGGALKTVAGLFVLAFIGNIMNLLNIQSYSQDVIKGIIIIIAVLFQKAKNS